MAEDQHYAYIVYQVVGSQEAIKANALQLTADAQRIHGVVASFPVVDEPDTDMSDEQWLEVLHALQAERTKMEENPDQMPAPDLMEQERDRGTKVDVTMSGETVADEEPTDPETAED